MSDTYRRYRAINQAIMQFYQPRPTGHREKHLNTLVALICGLTGGKHAHLPTIADHAPSGGATQESLIKRFTRFLNAEPPQHPTSAYFSGACGPQTPTGSDFATALSSQCLRPSLMHAIIRVLYV